MAAPGRWLRLDVLWEESDWLRALDGTAAGCWPRLLTIVKRDGVAGRCKRPSTRRLAEMWRVPESAINALEAAAIGDNAVTIEDNCWVVTNWPKYQVPDKTGKERQRRHREREQTADALTVVSTVAAA